MADPLPPPRTPPVIIAPPPPVINVAPPELVVTAPVVKVPVITDAQKAGLALLSTAIDAANLRLADAMVNYGWGETPPPEITPVDTTQSARVQAATLQRNLLNIVRACASVLLLRDPTGDGLKLTAIRAKAAGLPAPPRLTKYDPASSADFNVKFTAYVSRYGKTLNSITLPHTVYDGDGIGPGFNPDTNLQDKIGEAITCVDMAGWAITNNAWIDQITQYYTQNPDAPRFYTPF